MHELPLSFEISIFFSVFKIINDFVSLFSGFLTPLIAIIAIYIAYQQYLTNRNKLRFDLYQKRFEIFLKVKNILRLISKEAKVDLELIRDFKIDSNESKFLFKQEISDYIGEIVKKSIDHNYYIEELSNVNLYPINSKERKILLKENSIIRNWFTEEYNNVELRFIEYLNFRRL